MLTKLKQHEGRIVCNGRPVRTTDTVNDGDIIILKYNDTSLLEPNFSLSVPVAFESENLIVFDKPSNMPVHPSVKHQGDTLGNFFASLFPETTFRPVNRLDRDTSGLCVVAKSAYSANLLQNDCSKIYYAVVHGITDECGTIDAPIAREKESIILRCVRDDGKKAVTHYRRIKNNERYSLLEIRLETGRTHQIRVHLAHMGYALAGDDLYGGKRCDIDRHALHCGVVTFTEPVSREKITVKSEIPDDMKKLL